MISMQYTNNTHATLQQQTVSGHRTNYSPSQKDRESEIQVNFHDLLNLGLGIVNANTEDIRKQIDLVISEARDDCELEDVDENILNQIIDDTTFVLKEIYDRDFHVPELTWSPDESIMLVWYLDVGVITISLYGDKSIIFSLNDGDNCKMSGFFKSNDSVMFGKSLEIIQEKLKIKGISHI